MLVMIINERLLLHAVAAAGLPRVGRLWQQNSLMETNTEPGYRQLG
jgi:hypothetical protein